MMAMDLTNQHIIPHDFANFFNVNEVSKWWLGMGGYECASDAHILSWSVLIVDGGLLLYYVVYMVIVSLKVSDVSYAAFLLIFPPF